MCALGFICTAGAAEHSMKTATRVQLQAVPSGRVCIQMQRIRISEP